MKASLLIVDDEKRVLEVLVKTFENDYGVISTTSAMDGLDLLKKNEIQVIITDERMPKMNGMTFLKEAKRLNEHTVNIILTAYSDITVAIDAINSGIVYRYIVKPWDTEELKVIVKQAYERYRLLRENRNLTDELLKKNRELEENLYQLKTTQEKLLKNEKLAVVGQLTASIGHELRNPLSRIKAAAALLKNEVREGSKEGSELLQIVDNEVLISTKIINDLLDFSRDRRTIMKPGNFNDVMVDTIVRMRFPHEVELTKELDGSLPDSQMDSGQIQQVFINLLMNAFQAMEHGGKIFIKTYQDQDVLVIEIKDTGSGISPANLERIFEPLFTTKPKGIGLGMCIVKLLVEKHSGTITIQSRENIGTTVRLRFPLTMPS